MDILLHLRDLIKAIDNKIPNNRVMKCLKYDINRYILLKSILYEKIIISNLLNSYFYYTLV